MIKLLGAVIMAILLTGCATEPTKTFENSEIKYSSDLGQLWQIAKAFWNDDRKYATPKEAIPMAKLTTEMLTSSHEDAVFKLGHSSVLLRIDGEFILFDPVFSERAFPVQWMGPKRFHQAPISIDDLPHITAVVISHDHYDHLDKNAIKQLASKVDRFITPLKVGQHLTDWGVDSQKIIELDWWQQTNVKGVNVVATPSQHFSGRTLTDRDETLWASWVIQGWENKVFFSGDSGYFSGFKTIGEKFGPFDVTLIETGAYNKLWSEIHMMPEQSLQAHIDLNGKVMIPIHNGTFDLSLHDWFAPLESIFQLASDNDVRLATPIFGEALLINNAKTSKQPATTWWRKFMPIDEQSATSDYGPNKLTPSLSSGGE
ncbi:MBL fold metallo-hydrolase [Psychrosphaera sp. B3R10]|uniref:MBL fold metallo-hydrolase n=1 Tax=Psychrosphaera algicola TaxID=3023714 RepID=A0ABT5FGA5_9GAMM|nr:MULTISPECIES: MBL fold metallo-hydrolase [unclassified Psychrosphaera]MBU2883430.1 MBL fold metallo-hydrolase [Psychrosphaera sp. I2R16]MBU2990476.1 MBL fold metallo-hydrolase [Psychrosphaera sp. B3R10]MDC2889701.1 MBL fold metallo-hydrolase [Psychrosphaera sp. G1-22]